MNRLQGKVAIVTGGALGIGRACVARMAEEGAAVACVDVRDKDGKALAKELGKRGLRVKYWRMDVTREAEVKRIFGKVAREFGAIHALVNNAGIAGPDKPTHELTEAEWDAVQAVNVKGVFLCTKHAIPYMRQQRAGSIINLSSIYGLVGAGDAPPYHASKGAVRLMAKNDAILYASEGIRVNSVHPGFIWTPMVEGFVRTKPDPEGAKQAIAKLHPLGRMGEADDVAWGVVYLASDEAKFITGSELVIDGGYTAR